MTPLSTNSTTQGTAPAAARRTQPNLLHGYLFWTYQRGSFHYDVMVTLILLFLFLSPHFIDFHDRPIPEVPKRSNEFLIRDSGQLGTIRRFLFEVRAEDLQNVHSDADIRREINDRVVRIAPDAHVDQITPVKDPHGQVVAFDATVLRDRPHGQE